MYDKVYIFKIFFITLFIFTLFRGSLGGKSTIFPPTRLITCVRVCVCGVVCAFERVLVDMESIQKSTVRYLIIDSSSYIFNTF